MCFSAVFTVFDGWEIRFLFENTDFPKSVLIGQNMTAFTVFQLNTVLVRQSSEFMGDPDSWLGIIIEYVLAITDLILAHPAVICCHVARTRFSHTRD